MVMGQGAKCVLLQTMTRDDLVKLCLHPQLPSNPSLLSAWMMEVFQGMPVGLRSISPAV